MEDFSPALRKLSPDELSAYEKYLKDGKYPLGNAKATEFLALYLQGYSTSEIQRLYNLDLGAIVRAKIDFNWDKKKERYEEELFGGIKDKISKVQMESVSFYADGLAVYHKLMGDKFRNFLQTGDPAVLGEWKDFSFRNYKEMSEMLLKMTGQGPGNKEGLKIEVISRPPEVIDISATDTTPALSPENMLAELVKAMDK